MDDTLQLLGLPLHPLLVHGVVVLVPLTAIALLLAQFWPTARRRLGVVTPLAALVVLVLVPITVEAGEDLAGVVGPIPAVETHEEYGEMLLPWAVALFVVALLQWAWFRWGVPRVAERGRGARLAAFTVLALASFVTAAGNVIMIVLIGDSGARAVWGGVAG